MSNYYEKKDAKVRIAHELMRMGWKVLGYKEDQSDSMTDYYNPAYWDGIATKNGYILVVDNKNDQESKEITKYNPKGNVSFEDKEKISKLEQMTIERGCTEGEEENAKQLIEKIKSKTENEAKYEVVGMTLAHMGNPGKSIWHIEKDGKIYDKGSSLTKFSEVPESYEFDIIKMEFTENYKKVWAGRDENGCRIMEERKMSDEKIQLINDFKALILRFERVVNNMNTMGDGTEETELEGAKQQERTGYKKETVTEIKKIMKMVEVENVKEIKVGQYLLLNYHGGFWLVTDQGTKDGTWKVDGVPTKLTKNTFSYEQVSSALRGYKQVKNSKRYYQWENSLMKEIEKGTTKIYELKEVEEAIPVEKWVKIEKSKEPKQAKKKTVKVTEPVKQSSEIVTESIQKTDETQTTADFIVDKSTEIITALGLQYPEYKTNEQYKNEMEMILKNIKVTEEILKNISNQGCYGLTVLIQQWKNEKKEQTQKPQQNKTDDSTQLIEKINKSIESLDNQLQKLSGNHLTNTYKRMNEEANRESKRESFRFDINMLEYIKERIVDNQVTELEKALISGIFRDEIHYHYSKKYTYKPCSASTLTNDVEYPKINLEYDKNNWWNKEVPKKQKRLQKAGINNTEQLIKAVEEYKIIVELIDKPVNQTQKKIKELTSKFKMYQKGDVYFTPESVVERMIQFAGVTGNSKVLEPSAGIGNIADKIKEVTEHVDVCEVNYDFRELLELKGYNIVMNDFMNLQKFSHYDAVIMNPPFSNNQDVQHLKKAYQVLKHDGILVCITSPHWTFANDRTSQDFREWIEEKDYNVIDLPSGTFEMTGVSSKILVINKNEEVLENAI